VVRSFFRRYLAISLGTRLVVAFVAGAAAGLVLGPSASVLSPVSDLLTFALRVLAVPAVAIYILYALSDVGLRHLGRYGAPVLALFVGWSTFAAALGVSVSLVVSRLAGLASSGAWDPWLASPGHAAGAPGGPPLTFGADSAVAIAVIVAVPLSLVVTAGRERGDRAWAHMMHRLVGRAAGLLAATIRAVMEYAPFGVFALAALTFGTSRSAVATSLPLVLASVYLAHLGLGLALLVGVGLRGGRPLAFLAYSREALLTALATGSSAATVPVEIRTADTLLRVTPPVAGVAIGVGATLCKVGTTTFLGALVVWAGVLAGTPASVPWLLQALAATTVAGMLTPPISGGGFVMLGFVALHLGLPASLVPLLIGIPFVGKFNTPLNALGRLACACLASPRPGPAPVSPAGADADHDAQAVSTPVDSRRLSC
jgi:Na+/H+-dicarboxylate symporter